jgi:hypothetical protein
MENVAMRRKTAWLWLEAMLSFYLCLFGLHGHSSCWRMVPSDESPLASDRSRAPSDVASPAIYNFARLSLSEARELDRTWIIASLRIESEPMESDGQTTTYNCHSGDKLVRSVSFPGDRTPSDVKVRSELTVEGQLRIRFHDSWAINGRIIPAYFELRLTDAKVVKP